MRTKLLGIGSIHFLKIFDSLQKYMNMHHVIQRSTNIGEHLSKVLNNLF